MRQITLRGMDPEVERTIRRMAKTTGRSLNRVILDMIYQHTGKKKRKQKSTGGIFEKTCRRMERGGCR